MRWTVQDVRRMIECGDFEHPERFELVEGLIPEKMGRNAPRRITLRLELAALRLAFAGIARVSAGVPLPLTATNEPEVMVVTPGLRRDLTPKDVRLVLEVSDTSLRKDQTTKAALPATALRST